MENHDILKRLRYALDIKDIDMVEVFRLGGVTITKEKIQEMLLSATSISKFAPATKETSSDVEKVCSNRMFESFLNGFITHKRGKKEEKPGESDKQAFMITSDKDVNNVVLKKLKIALSLTSEEMLAIFKDGGLELSNSELSAALRRQGQRNYKISGDRYVKSFLNGLTERNRKK
jgi:uncharacterized protein YehS (DUF1456 family)